MKRHWGVAALAVCSVLTLLASIYVYTVFTETSIPTGTIVSGTPTPEETQPSDTQPTTDKTPADIIPDLQKREFAFTAAQVEKLNALLGKYDGKIALYYEDLSSGYTFRYHAEDTFFAASVIKAPYCEYLLKLIAEGKADPNQKIAYTKDIKSEGTGIVKNSPYGTEFTVLQLIENAIRHSDNAALRMLRSVYPAEGFRAYVETNADVKRPQQVQNITGANITAEDAGAYLKSIYRFIKTDTTYGVILRQYMTTTNNPMFTSASYDIIRKYGWATDAFHDIAIIDAPYPYILVLLTDHQEGTKEDFAMFHEVSRLVESFSGQATV